jgi:hypothetical protein
MHTIRRALVMASALMISVVQASAEEAKPAPLAKELPPKEPSLHVQCDGMPNNMSGGETAVRLLALTAVIGLLAPPPEGADPAKRKFGAEGVDVCTRVLTGDKPENNVNRRLDLIIARAIHQIEAKQYDAALADVAMARAEAKAAGLMDDPYFRRSRALSFDQIEAAALVRLQRWDDAQNRSLANVQLVQYSLPLMLQVKSYAPFVRAPLDADAAYQDHLARLHPAFLISRSFRYHDLGKFADAARMAEDWVQYDESFKGRKNNTQSPWARASAALAHGLAGEWDAAAARAADARQLDRQLVADGTPEKSRSSTAELLDLYEVARLAHQGDLNASRRMFTGRSSWLEAPFGALVEINARLRIGAKPEELIGTLAKTPDQMWAERRETGLAELIAKDKDNKTLFGLTVPYVKAGGFEGLSGKVWKLDKSKIILKRDAKVIEDPSEELLFLYQVESNGRFDAWMLHAALIAQSRGLKGLIFMPQRNSANSIFVRLGNPGDPKLPASLFIDAQDVIATLSPVIPDPLTLKARREAVKPAR